MEILLLFYIVTSIIVGTAFFYIKYCDIIHPSVFDDPTFTEGLVVFLIGMILSPFIFPIAIIVGFWEITNKIIEYLKEYKAENTELKMKNNELLVRLSEKYGVFR